MVGPAAGAPLLSALLAALRPEDTLPAGGASQGLPAEPSGSEGRHVVPLWNGATATLAIFGALSLSFATCALALPKMVDGPRRSALLQAGPRSDAREVK